jgi:hypothetical protein
MFSFSDMIKINIVKRSKLNILLIQIKVVNSVSVGILFFSIEMECFSFEMFRRAVSGLYCSYIYIYNYIYISGLNYIYIYNSTNIIQIQDKLIINYAIQKQCQTNIISKFKIFLNNQD